MRVNWRGKDAHMLRVGKGPSYDFATLGSALDSIKDASEENRYIVLLAAREQTTEIVHHNKSHVDLVGECRWTSVVERPADDITGGTVRVGDDLDDLVEDAGVYNLRIVRDDSGFETDAGPPEAALFIGLEEIYPVEPIWDRIVVSGCVIDGVHDGIQWFGISGSGPPPKLSVLGNIINSVHDGSTSKGHVVLEHMNNLIRVRTQGYPPYLGDIASWKSTCFHLNMTRGGPLSVVHPDAYIYLANDVYEIEDGTNIRIAGETEPQSQMTAVLFYANQPAGVAKMPPVRIVNPTIRLRWNVAASPSWGVQGIGILRDADPSGPHIAWNVPVGGFDVVGGVIDVHQELDDPAAPDTVYGVRLLGGATSLFGPAARTVRIHGTQIRVRNDKSGGSAVSVAASSAEDEIQALVFSDQPTSGNVSALSPVP